MAKHRMAFSFYGGKYSHLSWLLPLLPECKHYVEPFGGSGAVLLNRAPSGIETFNDIDGEIVNFFRVLREQTSQLADLIALTPFSREEFEVAQKSAEDPMERARRFYVLIRQSRNASLKAPWSYTVSPDSGRSLSVKRWQSRLGELDWVAERLLNVQLEQDEALSVIRRYDSPDTLFYLDPPYIGGGGYLHEMSSEMHEELSRLLNSVQGRVAMSAYRDPRLDDWYKGWRLELGKVGRTAVSNKADGKSRVGNKSVRQECLYCNW